MRVRTGGLVVMLHKLETENEALRREVAHLRRRDRVRGDLEADVKALRAELYARIGRGYVRRRVDPNRQPAP
jgi:hypothetical protein